jgi:hypothetical protein
LETQTQGLEAVKTGKFDQFLFCRANSKGALTKDLIEGLEKDIEKLKRLEENI